MFWGEMNTTIFASSKIHTQAITCCIIHYGLFKIKFDMLSLLQTTFASPRLSQHHQNNSNNKSSGDIKAAANDGQQQSGGRRRYPCMECGKAFVTPSKLLRHIYSHSGIRPFMCNICGKSFSQSANLKTHVKNTHPENCTQLLVPTPESMSTDSVAAVAISGNSSGSGDYDSSTVKSENSRPFVCNVCGKSYSESETLKNHVKNTHPESCTKVLIPTSESMTTAQHSSSAAAAAAMASLAQASQQDVETYTTASTAASNPLDDEDDDIAEHLDESDY